jgi:hypothetical protein
MDEQRLRALVAELDELVPRDGALVWEDEGLYGSQNDPAYGGNRLGYLRLGIEFLKVADAAHVTDQPSRVNADLSYLVNVERERGELAIFERREVTPEEFIKETEPTGRLSDTLQRTLAGIVVLAVLGLIFLGMIDVINWVGRR